MNFRYFFHFIFYLITSLSISKTTYFCFLKCSFNKRSYTRNVYLLILDLYFIILWIYLFIVHIFIESIIKIEIVFFDKFCQINFLSFITNLLFIYYYFISFTITVYWFFISIISVSFFWISFLLWGLFLIQTLILGASDVGK